MPKRRMPRSAATLTTSRLVDVPMVVPMPPIRVASPMGIRMPLGELAVRRHTLMSMGSSRTTIGVLLMTADSAAATTSVTRNDRNGSLPQKRLSIRPTGSSAPVRMRPWPSTISAQTAISASWPNPEKSSTVRKPSNGNSENPRASTASSPRLVTSRRARSRLNSASATTVVSMAASACMLGTSGMAQLSRENGGVREGAVEV